MYTLYFSPGTASMTPHLALLEIGAPYELKRVDIDAGDNRKADYLKLNPTGRVPTLLIDGEPFYETAALLMHLADRHPEARLAPPPGTPDRARWYQWIVHAANMIQPALRLWYYPSDIAAPDLEARVKDAVQKQLTGYWSTLDAHLDQVGPYLLGETYSAADGMLTMLMRWSRNLPKPAIEWPHLHALAQRVTARPARKTMYQREGLTEWQP